jgi:hypothetical protein
MRSKSYYNHVFYLAHRDEMLARVATYTASHREQVRAYHRDYYIRLGKAHFYVKNIQRRRAKCLKTIAL